jgi:protein TonB
MFFIMIGFSAALHGLVLLGTAKNGFRAPVPVLKRQLVSTIKMIKITKAAPSSKNTTPKKPQKKKLVEKTSEKPVEPQPELFPVQETANREDSRDEGETQENDNDTGNNEEAQEGETVEADTVTDREYEALLAYIKNFINKNLVYPPMARRRNIEGVVTVRFEIESNGRLAAILVDHSSGSSILDNAAVTLIDKMRSLNNTAIKRKLALRVNIEYKLTE